jgi:hypothetical protein
MQNAEFKMQSAILLIRYPFLHLLSVIQIIRNPFLFCNS